MFEELTVAWWWWVMMSGFCGVAFGWFIMSLCLSAGRADDSADRIQDQLPGEGHF